MCAMFDKRRAKVSVRVKFVCRTVKRRLKPPCLEHVFPKEVFENEGVNFHLPNFFKNEKQLYGGKLRQNAALRRENSYFWRRKLGIGELVIRD